MFNLGAIIEKIAKLCLKEISLFFSSVLSTFPFLHPSLPPFPFPFHSHLSATYFVPGNVLRAFHVLIVILS